MTRAGQEEHLEDGEEHRQVLHQLLLRRRHGGADGCSSCHHALLHEVQRAEHDDEQDVPEAVGESVGEARAADFDRSRPSAII